MRREQEIEPREYFEFREAPGPHAVGLRVIELFDDSRPFGHGAGNSCDGGMLARGRPLQTLLWYPAAAGSGSRMTLAEYAQLWATETTFGRPRRTWRIREFLGGLSDGMSALLWAERDAKAVPGRYPLIVYAPSFSAVSWENLDLCECLASFGYVVVASPSMGERTRAMTSDVAGIEAQARDISFLIGQCSSISGADASCVGVIGFSWGALSNVVAAARDRRVRALVALDGSLRTHGSLLRQLRDVRPEHMRLALLSIAQGQFTPEERDRLSASGATEPNVLNAWVHADVIAIHLLPLAHGEFASLYQRNEDLWKDHFKDWHASKAGYRRRDVIEAYGWMVRYTRTFLDAYLKRDEQAALHLKRAPTENGVPPHLMAVDFRAGRGQPASLEGFQAELEREGFTHAARIYDDLKKEGGNFDLTEESIAAWAPDLILDARVTEAVALLALATHLHPRSSDAWVSLGDAQAETEEVAGARESYRIALELDAKNFDAIRKLRKLEDPT